MKKVLSIIASALMLSASVFAQDFGGQNPQGRPQGERPQGERPERLSVEQTVENRTLEMIEKYGLNETQAAQIKELNNLYAGKITSLGYGNPMSEGMPNFGEMTQQERQEM